MWFRLEDLIWRVTVTAIVFSVNCQGIYVKESVSKSSLFNTSHKNISSIKVSHFLQQRGLIRWTLFLPLHYAFSFPDKSDADIFNKDFYTAPVRIIKLNKCRENQYIARKFFFLRSHPNDVCINMREPSTLAVSSCARARAWKLKALIFPKPFKKVYDCTPRPSTF